jgi:hypothetical protein
MSAETPLPVAKNTVEKFDDYMARQARERGWRKLPHDPADEMTTRFNMHSWALLIFGCAVGAEEHTHVSM